MDMGRGGSASQARARGAYAWGEAVGREFKGWKGEDSGGIWQHEFRSVKYASAKLGLGMIITLTLLFLSDSA